MSYVIYLQFRDGQFGYYVRYDSGYDKIYFNQNGCKGQHFPTYKVALSHAKWLRRTCNNIGRTDVLQAR